MTLPEQQAFQQARARIERNLARLAASSQNATRPPADFLREFIELAVDSLEAMGGAVWTPEGSGFQRLAEVSFASSGHESPRQRQWIEKVLAHTASSGKPSVVAVQDPAQAAEDGVGNEVPHPFFYIPVVLDGQPRLIIQVWLKQAGDPRHYGDIAAFLGQLRSHAEVYLRGWQAAALSRKQEHLQVMLRLQGELLGQLDPAILESHTANYALDLLKADVACIFRRQGRQWVLSAASNQEVVDAKAGQSVALARLAALLPESPTGGQAPAEDSPAELREALATAGLAGVVWCHGSSSTRAPLDRVLLAGRHDPTAAGPQAPEQAAWVMQQLGKALDAATHFQHLPFRPLVSAAGRTSRAWMQNRRRRIFTLAGVPAALVAVLLLLPVPWRITADCEVVPVRRAAVVAEASGKIAEVLVSEGTTVTEGQLLARLDDSDYLTQLAVSRQQLMRWRIEAAKAQSLGNEAERKIAEISAAREEEAIRRLEFLRSRTELRSPVDGVVLTRGLANRQGEALETGRLFCELAGSGGYELQLDIRQADLGAVLSGLERGPLPVDFILHAHPANPLVTSLTGSSAVGQIPETRKGLGVFLARAPFPAGTELEAVLKPGYTGRAKIRLGRRPLGWVLFHPFLNYLRTQWGV